MRIYLIKDEPIITKTLQDFLSDLGHEVVSVKSVYELLGNLEKERQPVDLIIGDFYMPKGNAATLICELHKRYPNIAIVIMIVDGPILSTHEAVSYGVYSYIRKPISLAVLELLLARLSESRTDSKSFGKCPPPSENTALENPLN